MSVAMKSLSLLLLIFSGAMVLAQPLPNTSEAIGPSGRPLPRFVSISAPVANLRAGPGKQYPIIWVYTRASYPLEVIAEYEQWRQVREIDGTEGWMHRILLSGKRNAIITGGIQPLYKTPSTESELIAQAEAGVVGEILECTPLWCRLDIGDETGWIETRYIWGTFVGEIFN